MYFDLLIQKLHEKAKGPEKGHVNMFRWFSFVTFDVIGDLAFGEPFDALKDEDYNFWLANIAQGLKYLRVLRIMEDYPLLGVPMMAIMKRFSGLRKARQTYIKYSTEKSVRRLNTKTDRRDLIRSFPSLPFPNLY